MKEEKYNRICGRLLVLIAVTLLFGCEQESFTLEQVAEKGDEIVAALESWYQEHQNYPETLDSLVPKYLDSENRLKLDGNSYYYFRVEKTHETKAAFQLSFLLHPRGFSALSAHRVTVATYDPLRKYEKDPREDVIKRLENWVVHIETKP